jgi:hypothetical protein
MVCLRYMLAENVDTELQQMAEDLKEIIRHINESNKASDQTDPVMIIGLLLVSLKFRWKVINYKG